MVRRVEDIDPNPRHLTPKQTQVLTFIRDFRRKTGYSPTMAEIAEHLGVSKVTVFEHVTVLEVKGWLQRTRRRARSLELAEQLPAPEMLAPPDAGHGLPLAGRIAAGAPMEAVQDLERLDLHQLFSRQGGTYLLRVQGDSMIGDHICPGDLAVIEQRADARDGEIVVALVEDSDATLKRVYRTADGQIKLVASNPAYPPRVVGPDSVRIQGVLVGVVRTVGR